MIAGVSRAVLFGAYQLSIVLGILLLPIAVAFRQIGIPLPIHRVIERTGTAYERRV